MEYQNSCRVCGLNQGEPPWGDDDKSPNYTICDCCGVEFGYGDCTLESTLTYRKKWVDGGCVWNEEKMKPKNWSFEDQRNFIPTGFQ